MPYDEYGWIQNWDVKNNCFRDRGDSCFFMGLQALNFILANRVDLAKELYERVKKYDFVRHPSVLIKEKAGGYWKNQTSLDMMLIWDYIAVRFDEYGFKMPPFKIRKSKFFWGKFRNPLMYNKFVGLLVFKVFSLLWKFKKFRELYVKRYYQLHLLMLYFAVVLEKHRDKENFYLSLLKKLRTFVIEQEKEFGFVNAFFRFLVKHQEIDGFRPVHNASEWVYQRWYYDVLTSKRDVVYHFEKVKLETDWSENTKLFLDDVELDLSEQFWYIVAKKARLEYKT